MEATLSGGSTVGPPAWDEPLQDVLTLPADELGERLLAVAPRRQAVVVVRRVRVGAVQREAAAQISAVAATSAWRLGSSGVLEVLGYRTTPDAVEIVQAFPGGNTLSQVLREVGPLSPASSALIVLQVAHALRGAASLGVHHGLVSPASG